MQYDDAIEWVYLDETDTMNGVQLAIHIIVEAIPTIDEVKGHAVHIGNRAAEHIVDLFKWTVKMKRLHFRRRLRAIRM